jgi:deazaflavin-dependent oxidoreductase (nitroreductase family)
VTGGLWRYDGRRVVVTGCASGIGAQLVTQLADLGAEVIGLDLRPAAGGSPAVDLADEASIDSAVAAIGGQVDVLFNVAGVSAGIGDPRRVVAVNFLGSRQLIHGLLPAMPAGSAIVNVASVAASGYRKNAPVLAGLLATTSFAEGLAWCDAHADILEKGSYNLSKAAVVLGTMSGAPGIAARGLRVNCLCPGVTETPILDDTRKAYGQEFLDAIPKPLGRVADPAEQASILAFLGSGAASYLNGEVLWSDGGTAAYNDASELLGGDPHQKGPDHQADAVLAEVRGTPENDWAAVIDSVRELAQTQAGEMIRTGTAAAATSEGRPLVLLTTTGAKSGQSRRVPVMRVEHEGEYAVVASLGGAPKNPGWYHNILASPRVRLMDGPAEHDYLALEATGADRDVWWDRAVAAFPDYALYQNKCERRIPVFVLRPEPS